MYFVDTDVTDSIERIVGKSGAGFTNYKVDSHLSARAFSIVISALAVL